MATRGVIARTTTSGIEGRYHHWDSYPSALGETLYKMYQGYYQRDITAMTHYLIDERQAGWSNIVDVDFTLKPGFTFPVENDDETYEQSEQAQRPHCYCHGERHEQRRDILSFESAAYHGAEYVYAIDEITHTMTVFAYDATTWSQVAVVDLDGPEPDWSEMEG